MIQHRLTVRAAANIVGVMVLLASLAVVIWGWVTAARVDELIEHAVSARNAGDMRSYWAYRRSAHVLLHLSRDQAPWLNVAYVGAGVVLAAFLSLWLARRVTLTASVDPARRTSFQRYLWISIVASLLPLATLTFELFRADMGAASSGGGIALIIGGIVAAAMALPVVMWGVFAAVLLRKTPAHDAVSRLLFACSFGILFLGAASLAPGADGGGGVGRAVDQGFLIGLTGLGELLRQEPLLGPGWLCIIAAATFAPPWLAPLTGIAGAGALGFLLQDPPATDRRDSLPESSFEARELRRTLLASGPPNRVRS